ncbi:hypothetical protein EPR50_G00133030 [Perca flavescens]|uniref:Uncharacterized protein n=1 Tax=Perca flavescens TaxID=8167 RepID=A0A484CUQ0_PERFV|nr:hypothetical protein EPR50_G00133030 [Perca flavescens]
MAHRYLRLSSGCRNTFRRLLPSNAPARLVTYTTTAEVVRGRSLLSDLLGEYRRLSSRPPKGFEKYFPEGQKTPKNTEAESATKGRNCSGFHDYSSHNQMR